MKLKAVYKKPMGIINLNGGILKTFLLKSKAIQEFPLSPYHFNIVLESEYQLGKGKGDIVEGSNAWRDSWNDNAFQG